VGRFLSSSKESRRFPIRLTREGIRFPNSLGPRGEKEVTWKRERRKILTR